MLKKMGFFLKNTVLILLGGCGVLAFISYRAEDASLNTASTHIHNWLGPIGAYLADLTWQFIGGTGLYLASLMFVWGILRFKKAVFGRLRRYLLIPTILLLCMALATRPLFPGYRDTIGCGGLVGFYFRALAPINLWYVQAILWLLVGAVSLYLFKVPVTKLPKVVPFCVGLGGHLRVLKKLGALKRIPHPHVSLKRKDVPQKQVQSGRIEPIFDLPQAAGVRESVSDSKKMTVSPKKERSKEAPKKAVEKETDGFSLPTPDLLNAVPSKTQSGMNEETMRRISSALEEVLKQYRINGHVVQAKPGPVVTLYEFEPASGVKTSQVISLADDIAREMRVVSVRIAVVPGSNVIGIEIPNPKRETVFVRELIETPLFYENKDKLPLILGKDIGGTPVYADLATMPHLLIAGTTGSGKSVAINTMILSLLYRWTPKECRLIMIDPKMLELSVYNDIPHLLTPVVTDPGKAVVALKWAVKEMEDRYRAMSHLMVRNIDGYNQKLAKARQEGKKLTRQVQSFDQDGNTIMKEEEIDLTPLPYIVIIVDEMADLMLVAGKEVEAAIQRLAQMARAAGLHLIMATQRPSVDVITGTIKANFPTRISFQVTSKIDSRTILGEQGAEQLLGRGDMLYMAAGKRPKRIHGPFVSDEEIEQVVTFLLENGKAEYLETVLADTESGTNTMLGGGSPDASGDDLYDKAVAIVLRDKKVSTSYVQRQLRIGYNKAADLIDRMEAEGVISKPNIAGKREILVGGGE